MVINSRSDTRRKVIFYILLFLSAFLLQTSILPFMKILGTVPELMFCCVICFAMFEREAAGAFVGLTVGIFYDSQSSMLSFNAILFMLSAYVVVLMMKKALNRSVLTAFLLCLSAVFLQNILTYLFLLSSGGAFVAALLKVILPKLVLTAACVYPIFAVVKRIYVKNTGPEYQVYIRD